MNKAESIVEAATQLPQHERVEIIEKLLESLELAPTEDPAAVDADWREELRKRSAQLRSGQVEAVAWDQVKEDGEKLFDGD